MKENDSYLYGWPGSLREANLHGANLEGALLFRVDLREANLEGASLKGAKMGMIWHNLPKKEYYFIGTLEENQAATDLRNAKVDWTQLNQAVINSGTILPNRKVYLGNGPRGSLPFFSSRHDRDGEFHFKWKLPKA